jgi:hypothetical protein
MVNIEKKKYELLYKLSVPEGQVTPTSTNGTAVFLV